jgi:uncharacterized protein YbjT (DUF2867 family)
MTTDPILVIGSNGKTGRRVMERLNARGIPARGASRSSAIPFDWARPDTWEAALHGVGPVYVTYYPDLALPGAVEAIGALTELARKRRVPRLVLLSGRGEEEAQRCEQIVRGSGVDFSIVRCSWFNQNFSESMFLDGILAGELVLPASNLHVPEPFVDADDIADVAVAALTDDRHIGQVYEMTGPRALTFTEAVAEISRATGRDIRITQIPLDHYLAGMKDAGVPAPFVQLVDMLFRVVLDGRNAKVMDGVQRALGRTPKDFSAFARDAAAAGLWSRTA